MIRLWFLVVWSVLLSQAIADTFASQGFKAGAIHFVMALASLEILIRT